MAIIKSGATSDQLTIDATSKAARVTLYHSDGAYGGEKRTYRAATNSTVAAPAATGSFFILSGSATTTVRVRMIRISGMSVATLALGQLTMKKYSTAFSGGTATTLTQVPLDSNDAAATLGTCSVYTASPTDGTLVGTIGANRHLYKSTTVVDGAPFADVVWMFGLTPETRGLVLRGTAQYVGVALGVGTATTCSVECEWTEE